MPTLRSALPRPELRAYVRAYAQRFVLPTDPPLVEAVPAQLEQVLNFELGTMPGVQHRECPVSGRVWLGGAQTSFPGYMQLWPGVESFAIFFLPTGCSQLFGLPAREVTDRLHDAESVFGRWVTPLWDRLVEESCFERRVEVVEEFLLHRALRASEPSRIAVAANFLFQEHGTVRIPKLLRREVVGLRQFERLFQSEMGTSPKAFAKVARFQAALDAKLARPGRSWLEIAHAFGYFDQMHMVHDFESLGLNTPSRLIQQMGDVRPPALVSSA